MNWRMVIRPQLGEIDIEPHPEVTEVMLTTPSRDNLNKIVVLNPKGGCGKSTLVTNLAARYCQDGQTPVVMDFDPQGSSMAWLDRRPGDLPEIHGIAAFKNSMQATRSWQLRIPGNSTNVLIDSPASINHDNLRELTRDATSILVPVLPSSMDIHAASRCIADLLLVAKIDRRDRKLAVVANRTRKNTKSFGQLMRFLDSLGIPIIAVLRDSQNFVRAAEKGIGLCEMQPSRVQPDLEQINSIVHWLDAWPSRRRRTPAATPARRKTFSASNVLRRPQFGSA